MSVIEMSIQEPYFTLIKNGRKKIEGCLDKGKAAKLIIGDKIRFTNNNKSIMVRVVNIVKYPSFEDYLIQEGLRRTLPNIDSIKKGVNIYHTFFTPEQEQQYGVIAIYVKLLLLIPPII